MSIRNIQPRKATFIIYAFHNKKLRWEHIKQEFHNLFGKSHERTVQGIQAWYYRMSQRIHLWDENGMLCFENEFDIEPKYFSTKRREWGSQDKYMEALGLVRRFPERAIHYRRVDPALNLKAQDTGELSRVGTEPLNCSLIDADW